MGSDRISRAGIHSDARAMRVLLLGIAFALTFGFTIAGDPADSSAKVKVLAGVEAGSPNDLAFAVRAPRAARQVAFYVDGRRRWLDRSPKWRFGAGGYLSAAGLAAGRHRLATKVRSSSGRTQHATRVVYLDSTVGSNGSRWRLPKPPPQAQAPAPVVDAGFEQGFKGWNMDGVGDVEPTTASDAAEAGASSGKVVLTGSQDRSELILDGGGGPEGPGTVEFHEGDERWYAFSFLVKSMQYGRPGAHNLIMQLKGDGPDSPNFGLQLWNYAGDGGDGGGKGLWSHGDAMGGDRYLAPIAHNQWNDVVIHFRASHTGNGFYELFLNGTLIDSRNNVSTIQADSTRGYIKAGLYRNGDTIPGTSEIRLDSARLGYSLAQVQAA